MVPDLDQRVPGIAHRGSTHTIWFALVVGVITAITAVVLATAGPVLSAVTGFVVGASTIGSHIAADALTPAGVRPWRPVDDTHTTRLTSSERRTRSRTTRCLGWELPARR